MNPLRAVPLLAMSMSVVIACASVGLTVAKRDGIPVFAAALLMMNALGHVALAIAWARELYRVRDSGSRR